MPQNTQFGWKAETTWGTAVTVDRFFEVESFEIEPETQRIEPPVMRAATRGTREDRFIGAVTGYSGPVRFPVMSKGFGAWMEHMTGDANASSGPGSDSEYTYTNLLAGDTTLCGKGFTAQGNMPIGFCGDTNQAFTWEGGKIAQWTLSCDQGGVVTFEGDLLFEAGTTATALASASYPTTMEFFPWGLSALTIGGVSAPATSWSVQCNNNLNADRLYIRNSYQRREPLENGLREITFSASIDFDAIVDGTPAGSLGIYNRLISATASGAVAAVVITTTAPTAIGGTSFPTLTITMDKVRIDEGAPTMTGPEKTMIDVSGKALVPVSGKWLELAYMTADTTA